MKLLPLTFQSWCELFVIVAVSQRLLTWAAQRHGTRILWYACAYALCVALICTMSWSLLMPLIPYATLVFAVALFMPTATARAAVKKIIQQNAVSVDEKLWLAHCLKTIFNHPHTCGSLTLLIAPKESLADSVHNTAPLNIPWHQQLFTSIFYDPHINHGMLWFTPMGILQGSQVQWRSPLNAANTLEFHAEQTAENPALVCIVHQKERTCTIIHNGTILDPKNISETVQYITTLIHHTENLQEGIYHGARQESQSSHTHQS
jgi:hypothetical protein